MSGGATKTKRLADPGTGIWLSYSIDRRPAQAVLKRFAPEAEQASAPAPAVRERIFTDELRSVTGEVLRHHPDSAAPGEATAAETVADALQPAVPAPQPEAPAAQAEAPPPQPEAQSAPPVAPAGRSDREAATVVPPPAPEVRDAAPIVLDEPSIPAPLPADRAKTPPDSAGTPAEPAAETAAEALPDLIDFPDKLDDAEEIRLTGNARPNRRPGPVIEDSLGDYNIGADEIDEIELEDPPAAEHARLTPPEPVATDTVAGRRPEAETESDRPGRTTISYREHEEHERRAAAVRVAENQPGGDPNLPAPARGEEPAGSLPGGLQGLPLERIEENFRQADYAYPPEFIEIFRKIYSARSLDTGMLDPLLDYMLRKSGAHAAAWLVLDRKLSSFRPFMERNLDVNTRKNLYFALNDRYLPVDEKYEILRFEGSLKNDFHFRKRFSTPFLLGHQGAVVINLNVLHQTSYIMLFYKRVPGEEILAELDRAVLPIIRDLLPAVQRIQESSESGLRSENNFSENLYFLAREMTNYGKTPLRIMHFDFPGLLRKSSRGLLMTKLGRVLLPLVHPDERIVSLMPGRLVVLLKKSDPSEIEEAVRDVCHRWGVAVKTTSRRFPDRGVNLFTYLESGARKLDGE